MKHVRMIRAGSFVAFSACVWLIALTMTRAVNADIYFWSEERVCANSCSRILCHVYGDEWCTPSPCPEGNCA